MKKNNIIIIALVSVLILGSCEDELDIAQKSVLEQEAYYANADDNDALELIAAVYRNCYTQGRYMYDDIILNCLSDDNWFSQDNSAVAMEQFDDFTVTADNEFLSDIYSHYYQLNYYCNLIIEKLSSDTDVKQRVIAEAKAVRAWVYINLIRYWGTPPLVDHVLSSSEAEQLTNGAANELWNYVETSLTEAAEVLPSKTSMDGQAEIGARLTKEACYSLLGKAKMWQDDYSGAATYLKKVVDSGLYDLVDIEDLYHPTGDFSAEYIWEFNANDGNATNFTSQNQAYKALFYGWRSDAVMIPDQMVPVGWGFGSPSQKFGEFLAEFDVTFTGEKSPRAKTLIASIDEIYTDGSLTFGGAALSNTTLDFVASAPVYNCAGYFRLREINWADDMFPTTSLWTTYSMTNIPYIRYAEVLLLYAEACLHTGATGEGLIALNKIRTRAGIPALSSYGLEDVKKEKRAEMYWEPERFADLVRWGDAATVLADEGKLHYELWGYKDDGTWDVRTSTGTNQNGFRAGKNELLPFPASEIYAAPNLAQNPGY